MDITAMTNQIKPQSLPESSYHAAWAMYSISSCSLSIIAGIIVGAFLGLIPGTTQAGAFVAGFIVGTIIDNVIFRHVVKTMIVQKITS